MTEPSGTDRPGPGRPVPDPSDRTDQIDRADTAVRWRLRDWPLRTKLVAVLLVPLVLAGVLGGLRVAASAQDAADLDAVVGRVEAGRQVAGLVEELQRERGLAVEFVAGGRGAGRVAPLQAQADTAGAAATAFTGVPRERFGPAAAAAYDAARVRVAGLGALRQAVTQTAYPADRVAVAYTSVVDALLGLQAAALGASEGSLQRQAGDLMLVADIKEQVQRQRATVLAVLLSGGATGLQQVEARGADAQLATTRAEFAASAAPAARERFNTTVAGAEVDARERLEQQVLSALAGQAPVATTAAEWNVAAGRTGDLVRDVEVALLTGLTADGAALAAQARGAAIRDGVLVGLLVLLAMALLVLVARSLVRPLRALRAAAFDVAQRRLPEAVERMRTIDGVEPTLVVEPIGIHTREEIGEVARAFDAVHGEAVRLAAQQALLRNNINDIFVNLSQRSQGLVKRQLALIDDLERSEQDPDHLGNLFQLDHLATRMRRNNENLLVLAGAADLRARRKRPVPARDVLRAAVSEIEQYQRVTVRRAPGIAVAGPVVNDLVHLVAELLDNATSFSPPDSEVVLRAATGAGGTLVVEIADTGVGIAPDELVALNAQLADPPVVDVAVARRMGLFVVGRLAQRHNLTVLLRPAPEGSGVHATVEVPAVYLQSGATPGADGDLDVPTQVLPVTTPQARPEPPAPAPPAPPEPRSSPEALPGPAGLPRRTPRRDGPVPADDPLSGPWVPAAPIETDERELPIYGEMRSAWFRQRRFASALGNDWAPQGPGGLRPATPGGRAANGHTSSAPTTRALPTRRPAEAPDVPAPAEAPDLERHVDPGADAPEPVDHPAGPAPEPLPDPVPATADADAAEAVEWGEVDAGWEAARSAADPRPDTTTAAGLPKRRPRSQLVPGSITPGGGPAAVRPPTRSPEVVRGRLSGYQRGLREGREARAAEIARRAADGQGG